MSFARLRGRLVLAFILGALVFIAISAYGDFSKVLVGLEEFNWVYLPGILALSFTNFRD